MKWEIRFTVKRPVYIDSLNFIWNLNFSSENRSIPKESFLDLYRHHCSSGPIIFQQTAYSHMFFMHIRTKSCTRILSHLIRICSMYQKKPTRNQNYRHDFSLSTCCIYIYPNDFHIYQNKSGHGILIMSLEIRKHTNIILPKTKIKGKF